MNTTISSVPVNECAPLLDRDRDEEKKAEIASSMKDEEVGQLQPGKVIDHGRKDADGIRYRIVSGQGRWESAKLNKEERWDVITYPKDTPIKQIVGIFFRDNFGREEIPWHQQGLYVRSRINKGLSFKEVAAEFHITERHARKLHAVVSKTAEGLEGDIAGIRMNHAEVVTAMEAGEQRIVIDFAKDLAKERKASVKEVIGDVIIKARELKSKKDRKEFSIRDLRKEFSAQDEQLGRQRKTINRLRIHDSNGPRNLEILLADKTYRKMLIADGLELEIEKFEKAIKQADLEAGL